MSATRLRYAFSLIELLVVIAILSLLLAIALPAIQRVRENANRLHCADRLRQLAVAAHHYHANHGTLPPGYLGPSSRNALVFSLAVAEGQWVGHFPMLLPYLEQQELSKHLQIDFSTHVVSELPWFWKSGPVSHDDNYPVAFNKLSMFICPSAGRFDPEVGQVLTGFGGTALGIHVYNTPSLGVFTALWKDDYVRSKDFRFLGITHFMGVAGSGAGTHPTFKMYEGIYTNRSRTTLGQLTVQDGTSNTLLYGETCGSSLYGSRPETADICWMAGGGLGTFRGLQRQLTAETISFSSCHVNGVQFAFADGSVRTLRFGNTLITDYHSPTDDWLVLQALAGKRDGQVRQFGNLITD